MAASVFFFEYGPAKNPGGLQAAPSKRIIWNAPSRPQVIAFAPLFCYPETVVNEQPLALLILNPKVTMTWRVVRRQKTSLLEVIDPAEWGAFTAEQQDSCEPVGQFHTEQEADKFATGQVDAAKALTPKPPKR